MLKSYQKDNYKVEVFTEGKYVSRISLFYKGIEVANHLQYGQGYTQKAWSEKNKIEAQKALDSAVFHSNHVDIYGYTYFFNAD